MTAAEELAALIYKARWVDGIKDPALVTDTALAKAILADGYSKHRTITTTAEVDALPDGSIVRTIYGDGVNIYRNEHSLPDLHHHVVLYGPATVLYEPGTQP